MKTHRIDCFGRTDESGNPAMVVECSALPAADRQAFARNQDAGATVFIDTNAVGEVQLDYYCVSGMNVYCRVGDDVYAGRNFNHLEPRFEDAATGVIAGALALSLARSLTLLQGDRHGQPCTLIARYINGAVQVGGRAVRAAAGHPHAI